MSSKSYIEQKKEDLEGLLVCLKEESLFNSVFANYEPHNIERTGRNYAIAQCYDVECRPDKPFTALIKYRRGCGQREKLGWCTLSETICGFDDELPPCNDLLVKCLAWGLARPWVEKETIKWLVNCIVTNADVDDYYIAFRVREMYERVFNHDED